MRFMENTCSWHKPYIFILKNNRNTKPKIQSERKQIFFKNVIISLTSFLEVQISIVNFLSCYYNAVWFYRNGHCNCFDINSPVGHQLLFCGERNILKCWRTNIMLCIIISFICSQKCLEFSSGQAIKLSIAILYGYCAVFDW